jgi:hypothetical protein
VLPGEGGSQTEGVGSWGDLSYVLGPVIVLLVVTGLAFFLRWAYRPGSSLIAKPSRSGPVTEYGLLVPVASPGSYVEGEITRRRLEDAGVRATLAMTQEGPRIMVFPADANRARRVLSGPGRTTS